MELPRALGTGNVRGNTGAKWLRTRGRMNLERGDNWPMVRTKSFEDLVLGLADEHDRESMIVELRKAATASFNRGVGHLDNDPFGDHLKERQNAKRLEPIATFLESRGATSDVPDEDRKLCDLVRTILEDRQVWYSI
jgi:hypothetical protein